MAADEWAARVAIKMIILASDDWRAGRDHAPTTRRGRTAHDAADWIMNPDRKASITFADACTVLSVEPSRLRAAIQRKVEKA